MKRALLVTLDFYPKIGGVANYYYNLCLNLPKEKIFVLTTKEKEAGTSQKFQIYREKLLAESFFVWPKWLLLVFELWKRARALKIELIWSGDILPTGTAALIVSKLLKIPYIVSCHGKDLLLADGHRRKSWLARFVLRRAKLVTVNSKYTGEIVRSFGVDKEKIRIIYPGINKPADGAISEEEKSELLEKYELKSKEVLLSVGRLVERKGFDKVIEAIAAARRDLPDLIYIISGTGEDRERLTDLAAGKEGIRFIGRLSDREKDILFSVADVFIMTSRASEDDVEGFGIVYLEAAIFGKPSIAGGEGGAKEAVVDGETGILVDPRSEQEIARAIIKLFKNKNIRQEMGQRAKERAEKDFLWQKIAKEMEIILN